MALPVITLDEFGVSVPDYEEVRGYFVEGFRAIFGDDIYIDPDSQDGQQIAIFSQAVHDCNGAALQVYNSFSPSSARGVGLSSNVKINGIERHVPTYSTVDLTLVGVAGTTVTNGIAKDTVTGAQWLLPASVVIPSGGEITVTATARDPGFLLVPPNSVDEIASPTRGWQSVTNESASTPGAAVETDAELRRRQTVSTMLPSNTVFEGTVGAVAATLGVTRYRGYENDTGVTDADGLPPHSISIVVEGGDAQTIGETIAAKKSPGTVTYGTTTVEVTDEYGVTREINFYRPTNAIIRVNLEVRAGVGYTTTVELQIRQAIVDWINALGIGEDVEWSEVYLPANLYGAAGVKSYRIASMETSKNGGAFGTTDLNVAFNEVALTQLSYVTVTVLP